MQNRTCSTYNLCCVFICSDKRASYNGVFGEVCRASKVDQFVRNPLSGQGPSVAYRPSGSRSVNSDILRAREKPVLIFTRTCYCLWNISDHSIIAIHNFWVLAWWCVTYLVGDIPIVYDVDAIVSVLHCSRQLLLAKRVLFSLCALVVVSLFWKKKNTSRSQITMHVHV